MLRAILDSGGCAELDAAEPLLAIDWMIDSDLTSSTGVFSSAIACEAFGHFPSVSSRAKKLYSVDPVAFHCLLGSQCCRLD